MRPRLLVALLIGVALLSSSCATNGYWADRRRDALDIFTVQVGYGLGVKVRAGCLQTGLLMDVGLGGLRGGEFLGVADFWPAGLGNPGKVDLVGGVVGAEGFLGNDTADRRGKSFAAKQVIIFSYPLYSGAGYKDIADDPVVKLHNTVFNPAPYFTQMDLVADVGVGLRLGLNPGEVLDFLLGWFGVDIYSDDLSRLDRVSDTRKNGSQSAESQLPGL
jgi:hypothetical protein